jgi:3-hydroxyisobutyrate dehydrogenase
MIGVVGLGAMGSRIAVRLLEAGHPVAVWNRTAAKAAPLVALGAERAATPSELAASSQVVITMVSDPAALQATASGPTGFAAGLASGADVVEMSTVGPPAIRWLRSQLPAGVGLVDAPVLGSVAEAERGGLTLYVGGSDDAVGRVTPVLTALGTVVRVGDSGAGAAAKLVANASLFMAVAAVGEALAFARSTGLDDEASTGCWGRRRWPRRRPAGAPSSQPATSRPGSRSHSRPRTRASSSKRHQRRAPGRCG